MSEMHNRRPGRPVGRPKGRKTATERVDFNLPKSKKDGMLELAAEMDITLTEVYRELTDVFLNEPEKFDFTKYKRK